MNDLRFAIEHRPWEFYRRHHSRDLHCTVTYDSLRRQIMGMAEDLAGIGIQRGDRVANVLPNGLPTIVAFLAGAVAGTAAPLNPAYRFDEFTFYLEDTSAKVLLVPQEGAEEARRAAEQLKIPVYAVQMDEKGHVSIVGAPKRVPVIPPTPDDVALVLHTEWKHGAAETRPAETPTATWPSLARTLPLRMS